MVFIKPTILRDDAQAAFETNAKYNYVRDQQLAQNPDKVRADARGEAPGPAAAGARPRRRPSICASCAPTLETVGQVSQRHPMATPAKPSPQ